LSQVQMHIFVAYLIVTFWVTKENKNGSV